MSKIVILIDNDPIDLGIMKAALNKIAPTYHCISFLYAEEALWVLQNDMVKIPDHIIIDLNMPVKNGRECLKELRKARQYKHIPITITSAFFHEPVKEALTQEGATFVIEKPSFNGWEAAFKTILKIS